MKFTDLLEAANSRGADIVRYEIRPNGKVVFHYNPTKEKLPLFMSGLYEASEHLFYVYNLRKVFGDTKSKRYRSYSKEFPSSNNGQFVKQLIKLAKDKYGGFSYSMKSRQDISDFFETLKKRIDHNNVLNVRNSFINELEVLSHNAIDYELDHLIRLIKFINKLSID